MMARMDESTLRPIQFRLRTLLIATAICGVICFLFVSSPTPNFYRVSVGMSRDEVLAIIGEPNLRRPAEADRTEKWWYPRYWYEVSGRRFFIEFDDQGLVQRRGEQSGLFLY